MPRQSAASLTVVSNLTTITRVAAPSGLSPSQVDLWNAVVSAKPADWFSPENAPILAEYVRACDMCERLSAKIEDTLAAEDSDVGSVKALLDMRDKESKRVASLGTKLRLTQQSRYTPKAASTAGNRAGRSRPWSES